MVTYFLKNNLNSLIKIGKSKDMKNRISQIKGQCSFIELSVLHTIAGNFESGFHSFYKKFRKEGEWFDIPGISKEMIEADLEKIKSYNESVTCFGIPNRTYTKDESFEEIETNEDVVAFLKRADDSIYFMSFVLALKKKIGGHSLDILRQINDIKEEIQYITIEEGETMTYFNKDLSVKLDFVSNIGDYIFLIRIRYETRNLKIGIGEEVTV